VGRTLVKKVGDKVGKAGVPGWRRKIATDSHLEE
jgi:hypothetical protein